MVWPQVLAESTGGVFVNFEPRTLKIATVNENTAMIKSRMVAKWNFRKLNKYTEIETNVSDSTCSSHGFAVLIVVFCCVCFETVKIYM